MSMASSNNAPSHSALDIPGRMYRHRTYVQPLVMNEKEVSGNGVEDPLLQKEDEVKMFGLVEEPITGRDLDISSNVGVIAELSGSLERLNVSQSGDSDPNHHNDLSYFNNGIGVVTNHNPTVLVKEPTKQAMPQLSPAKSSLGYFPESLDLFGKLKIPLILSITPFYGEEHVPLFNFILKCRGCRSFPHSRAQITENYDEWTCSICGTWTEVPREHREELKARWAILVSSPVIEYLDVTKTRIDSDLMPFYMFIIDASYSAISNGMLSSVIFSIKELVHKLPEHIRVGFATVDSSVQYYHFTNDYDYPSMLVVSEFEDNYMPLPLKSLLVPRGRYSKAIDGFLDSLEMLFEGTRKTDNCLGSVLKALSKAEFAGPGSLLVFQTSLPNIGQGVLVKTGGVSLLGTSKEYKLLSEKTDFYRSLTLPLLEMERSVDFFIFNSDFDIPSVVPLARNTGSLVHYYPNFRNEGPFQEKLFRDLDNILKRKAHSTHVKNVVPRGLFVSGLLGPLTQVASASNYGATLNQGDSIFYTCEFDERMLYFDTSLGKLVSFQAIVEYTDFQGRRLIRVINYSLPATKSLKLLYGSLDAATYASFILRQQAMLAAKTPMDRLRANLKDSVRTYLSQHFLDNKFLVEKLLVPYSSRTFPYLIHAALKHISFQTGAQIAPNDRLIAYQDLIRLSPELLVNLICPPLLSLLPVLPVRLNLSSEQVSRPGIYLLDFHDQLWCWVANGVDPRALLAFFNVDSYHALPVGHIALASLPPHFFQTLKAHFSLRPRTLPVCPSSIFIIKEADPSQVHWRQSFLTRLVEDQNHLGASYQQYLMELKSELRPR